MGHPSPQLRLSPHSGQGLPQPAFTRRDSSLRVSPPRCCPLHESHWIVGLANRLRDSQSGASKRFFQVSGSGPMIWSAAKCSNVFSHCRAAVFMVSFMVFGLGDRQPPQARSVARWTRGTRQANPCLRATLRAGSVDLIAAGYPGRPVGYRS